MRLKYLHTLMILIVIILLLIYSTWLQSNSKNVLTNSSSMSTNTTSSISHYYTNLLLFKREEAAEVVRNGVGVGGVVGMGNNGAAGSVPRNSASGGANQQVIYTMKAEVVQQQSQSSSLQQQQQEQSLIQQQQQQAAQNLTNNNSNSITSQEGQESKLVPIKPESAPGGAAAAVEAVVSAAAQPIAPPNSPSGSKQSASSPGGKDTLPTVTVSDLYENGFQVTNAELCLFKENLKLFIMIMSAPSHLHARNAIRLTWGHYGRRSDVGIGFLIGHTPNTTIQDELSTEQSLYQDLIIANFIDSYDNLTLKTMSMLEWMKDYCNQSEYLLKTDDDMFINVGNLLAFVGRIEDADSIQPKIYGRLAKRWKPVRNKKSKYYISFSQYRRTLYPDFTTGPAYLFRNELCGQLLEKSLPSTYLKLEDVFTTGIIADSLHIKRINIPDFANKKVNFHKTGYCALSRLISMHMVNYSEQFELWKKLLDEKSKCKIISKEKSQQKN